MTKRILIVEDNEDMLILYKRLFRKQEEVEIADALRGEAALELIPTFRPHLMLVDISLPGMTGLELTCEVRKRYPEIKLLVVTGHEPARYYDQAIRCGADDLVSKEMGKGIVERCLQLLSGESGAPRPPVGELSQQ